MDMTNLHPKARERLTAAYMKDGFNSAVEEFSNVLNEIDGLLLAQKEADAKVCDLEAAKRLNFGLTGDAAVAVACAKAIRARDVS